MEDRWENWPGNLPEDYGALSGKEQSMVSDWIKERLCPTGQRMRPENRLSSYGLKHRMERETGLYVTNGQFKGAMEAAGYTAFDKDDINWTYAVRVRKNERGRLS